MKELEQPPQRPADAAAWLLARHMWVARLMDRLFENQEQGPHSSRLEELALAFNDRNRHKIEFRLYELDHPEPMDADKVGIARWQTAGPSLQSDVAKRLDLLMPNELQSLKLVASLSSLRCANGWRVRDMSVNAEMRALLSDWFMIVIAQERRLPKWDQPVSDADDVE